jgi:hypothetical protein
MSTSQWYWSWVKSRELTAKASNAVPQSGGVLYSYRAPERGQFSAAEFKTSIDSISANINQQWSLWNNHIRPILDSLPSGSRDQRWNSGRGLPEKIDALNYGIQGTTLFVFNDANETSAYGRYWDEIAARPKTIAEALEDIWTSISEIDTSTSGETSSIDLQPIWNAVGSWYQTGSSSASGSIDWRLVQLESDSTDLLHDVYSTDAGLGFSGYGFPVHGVAEFIHYLAIAHGVPSGWNGGIPSDVSHGAFSTPTLDIAYDGGGSGVGRSITVDAGTVALTVPSGFNYAGLTITQNDATNNPSGAVISNAGTGASLLLSGTTRSISSTTADLTFIARSSSITLNESGDTSLSGFTATSIIGALNELNAYHYASPVFSAFAITGETASLEVGDSIGVNPTFTWTTTNSSNVATNSIDIINVTGGATPLVTGTANDGTQVVTLAAITNNTATTHVFRIDGENTNGDTFTSTLTFAWYWKVYNGTSLTTPFTVSANITGLTTSILSGTFAGTYSFAAGGYKYICYASLLGTASSFKDASTNLDVPFESVYTVSVTNSFSQTTTYNVHRSTNILGAAINIIVS